VIDQIRSAASVIVGRDGANGLEVLVLERGPTSRFLPGYVAFPGGVTDPSDEERAIRWFGSPAEARRACAVRELVEEVGLVLTADGLAPGDALEAIDAAPPSAGQLAEIAHWVAPDEIPVRFDARYFAVRAPGGLEPRPDGRETADAWWIAPERLLREWSDGRRMLVWPTYVTVSELTRCGSVDDLVGLVVRTRRPNDHELEQLPPSTFLRS
jgi:8-oxo-dGTP pyrophosphatase MutT (NUDIX family)